MSVYGDRRDGIYGWLDEQDIDYAYLTSDPDVRYLTGMPSDSVLILDRTGTSVLLPWDINLANSIAEADRIIPYTDYNRDLYTALKAFVVFEGQSRKPRLEIPDTTSYLAAKKLIEEFGDFEIVCRTGGLTGAIRERRAVKDAGEIEKLESAARITDEILDELETGLTEGTLRTELEIAMFLEREARARGAEGTGFETIVAGPARSNGIHAFPAYTSGLFASAGCGIIDFGVRVDGYTSDVTVTVVFGTPTAVQNEMLDLVQQAYDESVERAVANADAGEIARHVDAIFAEAGYKMPHSLGHGVGLEVHEAPWLRSRNESPAPLEPGMVFTIEPGLYHPTEGGVRLENDVHISESGSRVITNSRIMRLPVPARNR